MKYTNITGEKQKIKTGPEGKWITVAVGGEVDLDYRPEGFILSDTVKDLEPLREVETEEGEFAGQKVETKQEKKNKK